MARNQEILKQNLDSECYCTVGEASGALYATILMKIEEFDKVAIPNIIEFCKLLFA